MGEEEVGVYNAVKQAFEEYFAPRRYIIYERAKFFRRVQAEGESVEQFIRALNESADRCEFPERATQIRDRIVVGMRDQTVSREMQRMDIDLLTEAKAVSMARQAEDVERQNRELTLPKSVDKVKPSRRRKPRVAPSSHQSNTKSSNSDRITERSGPCVDIQNITMANVRQLIANVMFVLCWATTQVVADPNPVSLKRPGLTS